MTGAGVDGQSSAPCLGCCISFAWCWVGPMYCSDNPPTVSGKQKRSVGRPKKPEVMPSGALEKFFAPPPGGR
eukprot:3341948-Amphidinium_carterae.1